MPSSNATTEKPPRPTPSTATNDLVTTLSLGEVLRALRLEHAASLLDAATGKAITRNDSPTSLLDYLMREELRVQSSPRRSRKCARRAASGSPGEELADCDRRQTSKEATEAVLPGARL
jgi:hypothetical protein